MTQKRIITKIHSKYYDLTNFNHPGGPIQMELANCRDATELYESHHLFSDKDMIDSVLKKYEINDYGNLLEFELNDVYNWDETWNDPFVIELMSQVKSILKRSEIKIDIRKIFEMIILTLFVIVSFYLFIFGYYISLLLFPISLWLLSVNTFHDASHFSLSNNWKINMLATYLFPMFSSPFMWYHQHVIGHHCYPNIPAKDPDLYHGPKFVRHTATLRWKPIHKIQHYIMPIIWMYSLQMMNMYNSIRLYFTVNNYKFNKCVSIAPMTNDRRNMHLLGRVMNVIIVHFVPFLIMDTFIKGLIWSIIPMIIYSLCFMISTQINHLTENKTDTINTNFFRHQIINSNNVATDNYLVYLFTGGLNYQIEHHLFPSVNHTHLHKIAPIVKLLCKKYCIQYNEYFSLKDAVYSHYNHLRLLSSK